MISANFAVAVVTVVLRGLLDRILAAVGTRLISQSSAFDSAFRCRPPRSGLLSFRRPLVLS
jgi:hypothetical protein